MRIARSLIVAAAMAALPAALVAQAPERQQARGGATEGLIRAAAELQLTDAQVAQLRAIGERTAEANRPLIAQLRAERRDDTRGARARGEARADRERGAMSPERRAEMRERMQEHRATPEQRAEMRERMQERRATPEQRAEMRERMQERRAAENPVMQQVRENNRQAREAALAVLTPEQRAKAQAMATERRAEMRQRWQERRERGDRPARPGQRRGEHRGHGGR